MASFSSSSIGASSFAIGEERGAERTTKVMRLAQETTHRRALSARRPDEPGLLPLSARSQSAVLGVVFCPKSFVIL
eukprot:scaffold239023_cov32-Tisochrysis_lutea.AAC.1